MSVHLYLRMNLDDYLSEMTVEDDKIYLEGVYTIEELQKIVQTYLILVQERKRDREIVEH